MTGTLYLTRAALRRDADLATLAPMLIPDDDEARIAAAHRLAWSLFAGDPARSRDFLWREEAPGRLILLSPRPPESGTRFFEIETRPFAALPKPGERFAFALRANPTVSLAQKGMKANGKRRSGKPVDVVMHALHPTPGRRGPDGRMRIPLTPGEGRPFVRDALLGWLGGEDAPAGVDPRRPALDWLARQGDAKGFDIDRAATGVMAYRSVALPRKREREPAVFGQVDFEGALTVTDAEAFGIALRAGFGRAKAFGCGLMLLTRLPG